jgi:hypothetical protein
VNSTDTTTSHDTHPDWCSIVADDFHEPDVATEHNGRARTVTGYNDGPVTVQVRAQWWNPAPEKRRPPYNSPESIRPKVELRPDNGNEVNPTPTKARQLAAALVAAADELDPPGPPGHDG